MSSFVGLHPHVPPYILFCRLALDAQAKFLAEKKRLADEERKRAAEVPDITLLTLITLTHVFLSPEAKIKLNEFDLHSRRGY